MDNLQYLKIVNHEGETSIIGFKPYYKWITFNTTSCSRDNVNALLSFKPYYKWITFNT